ncbi:DALR anticodon-binding domain-containing protein 3 [Corythoichthys intestinalis]|uniref:DALR anticodon-binding domain-containing protein 3 n=1 Tax=Corythoichthys intestinalis TaxID=161448 RepID=UPI0025A67C63|nr:DALR anticodon-binding domain-containing protein 3 [Corythoichthys intestinalis]XP_061803552.1 DALR anticodon-binding domain-containing protein 3-like [Nerophis lumbriciformis]
MITMENTEESSSPLRITPTVRALSSALRATRCNVRDSGRRDGDRIFPEPEKLWFKESSAKNLRTRDFLSPSSMFNTLFADGQVPLAVMSRILSVQGRGVLPVAGGEVMDEGLRVRVDRAAAFRAVLEGGIMQYLTPPAQREGCVVLNCPALHPKPEPPTPESLTLGQLRTILLADHMGALLRGQGFTVSMCPLLPEESVIVNFLRTLGIDWPIFPANWTNEEREEKIQEALEKSAYREREIERDRRTNGGPGKKKPDKVENEGAIKINVKRVIQDEGLQGYDPSLGTCTVHRDSVSHLAQLDLATADCTFATATALHVTSCQDEFRQQQIAMLWRASGATHIQRHLVCGPVKTPASQLSSAQYLQLRRGQMKEASEMKYGDQVEGQTWDDIIRVMSSATIRFELLSTVHTSPVTLDVQTEGGVSTKGPRGGVFVMYNCARLHTLFDSYDRGVEKGLYPEIPDSSDLDFSALKEEGEWLLLFNYLIPFSELLDQSGQALACEGVGARVSLKTEQICKFLVSLSKDFSSYYNRVHVLGEPLPHLFNQMFCRLYLLRALRELYHSALETLNLPPIRQL